MKKNKRIPLILVVLVIICIIIFIVKLTSKSNNQAKKLTKIYDDLNTSQTYLFEMKKNNDNKTIMAKKDDKTIIDQYSKDSHSTTLVENNNTYLILHDRKEYYVYEQNNVEQSILTDGLKEVIDKDFTTGEEKIKGKKYNYEEYNGGTIFMEMAALDIDNSEIITRFYFDKNDNLSYIKTIYGEEEELLEVKLEKEVNDSIFQIPSDYAEN